MVLFRTFTRKAIVATGCYVGVVSYTPESMLPDSLLPARRVNESLWRMTRSLSCFGYVAMDYLIAPKFFSEDPIVSAQQWSDLHRRSARRCCLLAEKNGGLYIKTGQGVAAMNNIMPDEYCEEMRPLHDGVEARSFDGIERIICRAFGVDSAAKIFDEIRPEAIAAASIAQVHVGAFRGKRVAIKVQHEEVSRRFYGDMLTLLSTFKLLRWAAPNIDLVKMLEEVQDYMKAEFDFESEGRYADMFRAAVEERFPGGEVVVPRVLWEATRGTVLVSEFFDDGVRADALDAMRSKNVDPNAAALLTVEALAYALFQKGIVHADPHPGNILVRARTDPKSGRVTPQVAILDFGLTVILSESFRKDLVHLYRACALHDDAALAQLAPKFGLKADASPRELSVFASCTMQEPYELFSLAAGISYCQMKEQAREYWDREGEIISALFSNCPREYTMAITNLDMVRALHHDMKGKFSRVLATLEAADAAAKHMASMDPSLRREGIWNRVVDFARHYRRRLESQVFVWIMMLLGDVDNVSNKLKAS